MIDENLFTIVGMKEEENVVDSKKCKKDLPYLSLCIVGILVVMCLLAEVFMTKDPKALDLNNCTHAPSREFLFGTDTLGRDIFSCILYGGRISIFIGFFATAISTLIAVVFGSVSGLAPKWLDTLMMRMTELFLSIPTLLVIIFVQAILGKASAFSIAVVIGITSWCSIAKVVRTEVRQLRSSEYVVASKCMGGSFFHVLKVHLAPNFISSIMFMVVMNVRSAIVAESTLSFIGLGLPLETISWGSMLSLADKAFMTHAWWMIVIPGACLVVLLMCVTNIGNWLRQRVNQKDSNI